MAIVIPTQHYVTIQYRKDSSTESGLLGFASPYTKDAAFEKRRRTQEAWAYGGHDTSFDIDAEDRILPNSNAKIDQFVLFASKCYPIIINNEPLEGFEVSKNVKRYGWNGSGNVVWRIADPRGFELEISSDNFARIIDCATVENGKILGKCLWGRDGAKNILLPEASDVYQEAVQMTIKVNTKISLNDIQNGDTVELLGNIDGVDDQVFRYLGKYFFLGINYEYQRNHTPNPQKTTFNTELKTKYLVQSVKTGKYSAVNSLKIVNIINKVTTPLVKVDVAKEVTASLRMTNTVGGLPGTTIISATRIKLDEVAISLVPMTEKMSGDAWPSLSNYGCADVVVVKADGKTWIASNNFENKRLYATLDQIEFAPEKCAIYLLREIDPTMNNSGYYSYSKYYRDITIPVNDIAALDKYRIEVRSGDLTGIVYNRG